jgi:putative endopeptidase
VIELKNIDKKIRPQDDFFHFATGGWIRRNPIPADRPRWGTFDYLRENSTKQLRDLILPLLNKKHVVKGSYEQLVVDLWRSGMDEKGREKRGLEPLLPILNTIEALTTKEDLLAYIAESHRKGYGLLWGIYVGRDDKQSTRNMLYFAQSGLSLPDRDYYLSDDTESKRIRNEFVAYIKRLLALVGRAEDAEKTTEIVLRIETALAKASMTRVERRDPHKQYNKRTLKSLTKEAPKINWARYFALTKVPVPKEFIISQPLFIKEASKLIDTVSLEDWKIYLRWSAIDDMASFLTKKMVAEKFSFYGTALYGIKKMQPLWKRIAGVVDGTVGDALGKLYVEEYFDTQAKRRIDTLVDNLFAAFKERLSELEWMSPATKKKAFVKLRGMKRKLGYPTKWEKYKGLHIEADDLVGNLERAHIYGFDRMIKKLKKKPDPAEWYMTPPTVNAYFDPNANEIAFPAGIMQPPFFDMQADDAVNYGGIGSVIGHEITHGFDDEGRKFDDRGNLKDWWTAQDKKKFEQRAQVLAEQFDHFVAVDDMHVNGKLTLGENIADLGGIIIAFKAFQKSQHGKKPQIIDGFTPEQRFFLGYALTEAGSARPEYIKKQVVTDPHSPSIFRVNGPLSNIEAFYEAFGVKKGDQLYRDPSARAKIW